MRKSVFLYFLTPFLLQWIVSYGVQILAAAVMKDTAVYAAELTVVIALLVIPAAWYMYQQDSLEMKWKEFEKISGKTRVLIWGLGICSCISLNSILLFLNVQTLSRAYQDVAETIYESSIWIQFLGMGVAAPVMEELLYRGLLYRRMRRYISARTSIIVSAVAFGIMHGNFVQFLFATGLGMILALVYERYGKLELVFQLHIAVNLTSLSMTWLGGFERILSGEWLVFFFLALTGSAVCIWKMLQKY